MQPILHPVVQVKAITRAVVLLLPWPAMGKGVSSGITPCPFQESLWPDKGIQLSLLFSDRYSAQGQPHLEKGIGHVMEVTELT